jgi:PAS domain S-box-containing protein
MNNQDSTSPGELERLRGRVSDLARDNAHLKLINRMLLSLTSASGLENVVEQILRTLMETIGAFNLLVYYIVDGRWHCRDLFGSAREMESPDNPLVAACIRERAFQREQQDAREFFPGDSLSENWAFPLLVQQRLVGIVAMEGMIIAHDSIRIQLQPFFVYAALMLGNEISNYSVLEQTHQQLLQTHQALERETTARQEVEKLYRMLFEQSPDGIMLIDPESLRTLRGNHAAHRMLGYSLDEFAALAIPDVVAQDDRNEVARRVRIALERGDHTFETRLCAKGGEIRDVLVTMRRMTVAGQLLLHAICRDITDTKKMEQELLKNQKLESIGLLAGGIAHDFNNLLAAIMGNISLASMLLQPGSRSVSLLAESEKACLRARDLTLQLLTFSKGGAPVRRLASVEQIVRESASFVVRGSGTFCNFHVATGLWQAEIDEGQISQVIHNLVINAVQAMPHGGVITITCSNVPAATEEEVDLIRIDIEDQGEGITPEVLPRIFDPYFTTKQQGSGLGLASSYSIIRNHGGYIEVNSLPGKGAIFSIFLPATVATVLPPSVEPHQVLTRPCKILVMDDEEMLRDVITSMLNLLGHRVETACDGKETLTRYQRARDSGDPFDAVILDLTVPGGMGGRETMARLREIDPGVKGIVSSGYASDMALPDFRSHGFCTILPKPYSMQDLIRVLEELFAQDDPT